MTTSFRIDNNGNIRLPFERHQVQQIRAGIKSNIHIWRWVWFCSGEGGCQRSCGGFGDCIKECNHYSDQHNFNNPFDMHKCSVRILTEVSEIDTEFPVCMTIKGSHVLQNIIQETNALSRINLNREARDLAIKSHRADKCTTKEIKMKLLAPYNNALQNELEHLYNSQNFICDDIKLQQLIERDSLHARKQIGPWTNMNAPEDNPEHYYQLTLRDNLWLQQACNFGSFCFGINSKYDLNSDNAPILPLVVKDNAGFGTPIAFGVSNKENNYTIRLTVEAVQRNVPCNNNNCNHEYYYRELANNKGFMRIRKCAQLWQPFAMINKYRPTKRGLQPILRGVILCWFHIMQTLGERLKDLRIDDRYRYPIAMVFKIVGRSRSKKEALELGEAYRSFIKSLPLMEITKDLLCNNLYLNWISEEWINCFIDGGRMPSLNDIPGAKPMTTNNLTERMNKSVEGQRVGTQLINSFIERQCHFFLYKRGVTEKYPFRPMEMPARRISDVGTPKMHGAKPRKSNGFISDKENYIIDDDPMQLDNEIELLVLSETDETLTNNRKEQSGSLAPSIQRRVTAAICNCKRNISKNKLVQNSINVKSTNKDIARSELEKLFSEKRTNWKRCEFIKACLERSILLDDNIEQNKKIIYVV
ncbi:hypothetical protein C2G38_2046819 [Gigaspora rosea]|uniref:Uncharacterized protein n=1 Tax=Gigaspora rosea TaxID=44941 RepID=A0A397UGH3_9GLOM|nr:hypothetical protein C2G38_2046819 [Gigaspora rosea]